MDHREISLLAEDEKGTEHGGREFVVVRNAKPGDLDRINIPFRGFHMIRDPRDIVVSAYFSHKHSHKVLDIWPELDEIREKLQKMPQSEGLLWEFDYLEPLIREIESWDYDRENIMELKMEEVITDTYQSMLRVFKFLGLLNSGNFSDKEKFPFMLRASLNKAAKLKKFIPTGLRRPVAKIPAERLLGINYQYRFEKLAGRKKGEENKKEHYRKGVAGDWKNYFDARMTREFKDRFGAGLVKLGYETDLDW